MGRPIAEEPRSSEPSDAAERPPRPVRARSQSPPASQAKTPREATRRIRRPT